MLFRLCFPPRVFTCWLLLLSCGFVWFCAQPLLRMLPIFLTKIVFFIESLCYESRCLGLACWWSCQYEVESLTRVKVYLGPRLLFTWQGINRAIQTWHTPGLRKLLNSILCLTGCDGKSQVVSYTWLGANPSDRFSVWRVHWSKSYVACNH
jgi:hypothetical protein